MPYYSQIDPTEQYRNSNFDALTGRLQGGQMVMQILNQIAGNKRKKKEEGWELEDREMNKRLREAQISNYYETTAPKEPKPTSKVSPLQVKTMMKRLAYPDEAISEVDSMNEPALKDTWGKLQDHFRQITSSGGRVPATAATAKGRLQQQQLKTALGVVTSRKSRYNAALSQLYANPEKGMLVQSQIANYEKNLDDIETQEGEIASMMNNIDESGELTENQFVRLNTILKFKRQYNPQPSGVIKKKARSSSGKEVDVISKDGGKTWTDLQGNIIPIGK